MLSTLTSDPTIRTLHVPTQEVKMTTSGALLVAGAPRYETIEEYVSQFGAPRSSLPSHGWFSFSDRVFPELVLVVVTQMQEVCTTCGQPLGQDCLCPF
jgi:hypothetical protein